MIKYEVKRGKKKAIWLEVGEHGYACLVEDTKLSDGVWNRCAILVPMDGLMKALVQATTKQEVG